MSLQMERHSDEFEAGEVFGLPTVKWEISRPFRLIPAFTSACTEIGCVGIRRRIPQRDCSGFSPDSMHPHQVIVHTLTKPTLSGKQKVIQRNHTVLYHRVFFVSCDARLIPSSRHGEIPVLPRLPIRYRKSPRQSSHLLSATSPLDALDFSILLKSQAVLPRIHSE
jgi:hypothetical protein